MVFLCGVINILITVTRIRKLIIKSIPESLQNAIGGGIGIFIAYIGIKSANLLTFTSDPGTYEQLGEGGTVTASSAAVPALAPLNTPAVLLAIFGLILTVILIIKNVRGAILIGIIITAILGIPFGVTKLGETVSFGEAISITSNLPGCFETRDCCPCSLMPARYRCTYNYFLLQLI